MPGGRQPCRFFVAFSGFLVSCGIFLGFYASTRWHVSEKFGLYLREKMLES
jgi:hypothetical protein